MLSDWKAYCSTWCNSWKVNRVAYERPRDGVSEGKLAVGISLISGIERNTAPLLADSVEAQTQAERRQRTSFFGFVCVCSNRKKRNIEKIGNDYIARLCSMVSANSPISDVTQFGFSVAKNVRQGMDDVWQCVVSGRSSFV